MEQLSEAKEVISGLKGHIEILQVQLELSKKDLRDQFALAALTGFLRTEQTGESILEAHAKIAYKAADVMLEERNKVND